MDDDSYQFLKTQLQKPLPQKPRRKKKAMDYETLACKVLREVFDADPAKCSRVIACMVAMAEEVTRRKLPK